MVRRARKLNRHRFRCKYLLNDRPDLSLLASDSFDFVYSVIVLQHMEPRYAERYIPELIRVLGKGGVLLFQVPSEPLDTGGGRCLAGSAEPAAAASEQAVSASSDTDATMPDRQRHDGGAGGKALAMLRGGLRAAWKRAGGGIAEVAEPQMEMHGIARERVEGLVVQAGGRILDVRPDTWPGPGWLSFIYTVTK